MNRLILTVVAIVVALPSHSFASATDCTSGKSLRELANEASVILYGTLTKTKGVGYELADGTISKAGPMWGMAYFGSVEQLRIRVLRVVKGEPGRTVEAYFSVPILNPSKCPERPLLVGQNAVLLLSRRPTGYWVVGGRDGIIFTGDDGVSGIVMQFTAPVQVK